MKKYTFNKAAHMGSLSYRLSDRILHMPMWLLFGMSVILSIILGMVGNYCAEITSNVVDGVKAIRDIFIAYLVINIMYVIIQFSLEAFMRAFRLNTINNSFLKEYDRVFKSRTFAISQIGPAKIESTVNARACIIGDMACCSVSILRVAIPFIVIIYKIAVINWIAAIIMLTLMVIAALMMLFGDKILHFNTSRAEMKGDMQTISVNNFMVVRMLKYMGAFSYAHDRLKVAQDEANPSIHCVTRIVYNGFVSLLYNTPTIIAIAIAMLSDNLGLAVFVAINEWSISALVDRVVSITESFSEKFGYDHVLESLKADDVPVESKPVMPEHMILKGVEFYYPTDHNRVNPFTIDNLMIEKGKRYRVSGPSGSGKAEPLTNWIPTVDGFKRMGDLKVGDYVYARNGFPERVTHIFDRGELDVYKVTFNDGRSILVSEDHLFGVWTRGRKTKDVFGRTINWTYSVIPLKNMFDDYKKEIPSKPGQYSYKYVLPRIDAIRRPYKPVPLDPWVLGCFIGNGCCRQQYLTISSGNDEVPNKIARKLGLVVKRNSQLNYNYTFYTKDGKLVRTREFFKDIPDIIDCYSHDKHIPREYIDNHLSVRMELLRGLMDTDGSISNVQGDNRYHVTYSTSSRQLAKDVLEILYSIGYSGGMNVDKRVHKYKSGFCCSIVFRVPNKFKKNLFTVGYKRALAEEAATVEQTGRFKTIYEYNHGPIIYNIKYIGKMPCRCIRVQNIEHLYLSGHDYIATHNSSYFKYLAGEMEANKPFEVRTFYIHQRSELVAGTVRENLTLGNSYVPDRVLEELIREVKLGEWFDRLPDGLDTKLGDCGLEPSGGEASRISLLRLFVHLRNYTETGSHPITDEVIILDEVTSALDKRDVFIKDDELSTEETVIKVIDRETRGCTMFVISHEDVSSSAFGFKDIVDEQLIIDILPDGRRVLKSM